MRTIGHVSDGRRLVADVFGLSEAFLGLTTMQDEMTEVLASHSFLSAHWEADKDKKEEKKEEFAGRILRLRPKVDERNTQRKTDSMTEQLRRLLKELEKSFEKRSESLKESCRSTASSFAFLAVEDLCYLLLIISLRCFYERLCIMSIRPSTKNLPYHIISLPYRGQ